MASLPPAAAAALHTPELLEAILLSVSMRDLLTSCVRVCWHWHATIDGSPALQRHLLFLPSRQLADGGGRWDALSENPLLKDIFPVRLNQSEGGRIRYGSVRAATFRYSVLRNYLRMVSGPQSVWMSDERFYRKDASWRRVSRNLCVIPLRCSFW
jgi:hypothetical protein